MVAIDDTRSMLDNHAGTLALEAMAVICQALQQLEIGQLAVAKFGETTELLHEFGQPFTSTAAARIVSSFSFQQEVNKEDMRQQKSDRGLSGGLEVLMQTLQMAQTRGSGNGNRVTQLVFAISDGLINEGNGRERIKRLVRDATARQQLLVLLVVDNADTKGSILETKRCEFVQVGKNKPKKMVTSAFLDDYPFPYYVILRSVETLPETLADALRQWFEMIHRTD
jgi:midasin